MSFNLEKYLVENNLTIISKVREAKKNPASDEDAMPENPTASDLKKAEKEFKGIDKKMKEYADLQQKVKAILSKYTVRDAEGNLKLKDVAGYKKEVGNMPDRLKVLKKQIDAVKNPEAPEEAED